MSDTMWLIYDGRWPMDPDRAIVLEVCSSLFEGLQSLSDWPDMSCLVENKGGKERLIQIPGGAE